MKTSRASMIVAAAILLAVVQQASATGLPAQSAILYGTTGACHNQFPGGPCSQTSKLVQLDPVTGALIKTIGEVGYTVNGLAWDWLTRKLYATTAIGDVRFHGLITINPLTGAGTPVNPAAVNFGLAGNPSPIHSLTIDFFGRMAAWYDEFNGDPIFCIPNNDTFVTINKKTGIATEFGNTGIDSNQNGLSFSNFNILYNIDAPRFSCDGSTLTQTAYIIDPSSGKAFCYKQLTPPTAAALGDFNPDNDLYYGLNFDPSTKPPRPADIVVIDMRTGIVTRLGSTAADVHTLAFVKTLKFF